MTRPDPRPARILRNAMSLPEIILWSRLKNRQLAGLKFRRQHSMLEYVLDFFCAERQLAVEVDGRDHDEDERARRDLRRDRRLAEIGILTLRVQAIDVLKDESLEAVLERIRDEALARPSAR